MKSFTPATLLIAALAFAGPASAQVTLYENDGFSGLSLSTERALADLADNGFNDRASSAVVTSDRWEICSDANYGGRCVVLRPGSYASLSAMGLNDRVSSVRRVAAGARVEDERYGPMPVVDQDDHRRDNERLYEADVLTVHAVVATPQRRCWVERDQATDDRGQPNVPGAIVGAVIGGILGHQVGGGTGRSVATVGGAVGGAALGADVGRERDR
ncbi:MAG: glycine zipper 2TM domain-containing protein, partial [Burkholderiales bacterium]|nr:glycine zipper 2TM domain-containing protein [Burkholderiales bacterium]